MTLMRKGSAHLEGRLKCVRNDSLDRQRRKDNRSTGGDEGGRDLMVIAVCV